MKVFFVILCILCSGSTFAEYLTQKIPILHLESGPKTLIGKTEDGDRCELSIRSERYLRNGSSKETISYHLIAYTSFRDMMSNNLYWQSVSLNLWTTDNIIYQTENSLKITSHINNDYKFLIYTNGKNITVVEINDSHAYYPASSRCTFK